MRKTAAVSEWKAGEASGLSGQSLRIQGDCFENNQRKVPRMS